MLNSRFASTNDLVTIPGSYLLPGDYYISLQLTNFLGTSGQTQVHVAVVQNVVPRVSIAGSKASTLFRWQSATFYAVASVPPCAANLGLALSYLWKVYRQHDSKLMPIQSTSLDPRYFKIPAYSFEPLAKYVVQVIVTAPFFPNASSTASTLISMGVSGVVAVIGGGTVNTFSATDSFVVDASGSYDLDYPTSSVLFFGWTCVTMAPTFGAKCLTTGLLNATQSMVNISQGDLPVGQYVLSVYVTNYLGRQASTNVTLIIVKGKVPQVSIAPPQAKYNPTDKIILTGTIGATIGAAWAAWNSSAAVALPTVAMTPLLSHFPAGQGVFQLAIRDNVFAAGMSYTIKLGATYERTYSGTVDGFAQVTITMNAPPLGGRLGDFLVLLYYASLCFQSLFPRLFPSISSEDVKPQVGRAFNTSFFLYTYLWVDDIDDYPLGYVLSYYSVSPTSQVFLKAIDSTVYANAVIGQGASSLGYRITCLAFASDVYGCAANASRAIVVRPPENTAALAAAAKSAMNDALATGDSAAVGLVIGAATMSLNSANCSALPAPCSKINREACSTVANTCGPCLPGYIGQSGSFNVPCGMASSFRRIGASCDSNSQCFSGFCQNGFCATLPLLCANNCTGHGICIYTDMQKAIIPTCAIGNPYCSAACVCKAGFFGSDCKLSRAEFDSVRATRELFCESLAATLGIQDVSSDVIASRMSSISSILLDMSQISDWALGNCSVALIATITDNPGIAGLSTIAPQCMAALSNVLEKGSSLPSWLLGNVSSTISVLSNGMQANMAIGEAAQNVTTKNAQLGTSLVSATSLASANFGPPRTAAQAFDNVPISSMSFGNLASTTGDSKLAGALGVTAVQYNNNPFGTNTTKTTILGTQVLTYGAGASGRRRLLKVKLPDLVMVLPNTEAVDYSRYSKNGTVLCLKSSETYTVSIKCHGNTTIEISCEGTAAGDVTFNCPSHFVQPKCVIWDGTAFSDKNDCKVVAYTPWNTTCSCPQQVSSANAKGDAKAALQQTGGTAAAIGSDFVNTWKSAGTLSLSDLKHNLNVVITTAAMTILYFAGLAFFTRWDRHDKRAMVYKRRNDMQHKRMINFENFMIASTPVQLDTRVVWYVRWWYQLTLTHRWLSVFRQETKPEEYRVVMWMSAMGAVIHILFVTTLLALFTFPADGNV